MGLFKRKKKQEEKTNILNNSDNAILREAVENGTPCIPFIPINALRQSLTVLKPEGFKGYFVARIPALYPDGNVKYLLKEEFMLWNVANGAISNIENVGRSYFFIGFETLMTMNSANEFLNPQIFYQPNYALFRVDTDEKLEFTQPSHSPSLDLTYIPADHNIQFYDVHVVNFLLVADLYPLEERGDPSGYMESYEQWKNLQYPIEGGELQNLFDRHVQGIRDSISGS